jgi:DNA-binding transcriptional MerR regulator
LIRRIRELLYDQGFTISGARNRLDELVSEPSSKAGRLSSRAGVALASLRKEIQSVLELLRA